LSGFKTEPEAVAVRTGEGLTLTCVVSGDEPDSITWFKDGALVVSASAVFEIQSNYDALTFTKVQFDCSKSCLYGKLYLISL